MTDPKNNKSIPIFRPLGLLGLTKKTQILTLFVFIPIDDIREIRLGKNTEQLRLNDSTFNDLQIIASHRVLCGLLYESVFDEADTDNQGFLDEKSAIRLIRQINGRLSSSRIKNKVKEAGCSLENDERGKIYKTEFVELYKEIATRPEVYFLMVRYANKDYLSCQDLRLFLETEQGMVGVTSEFCENLIEQHEPAPEAKENNFMTVDGEFIWIRFVVNKQIQLPV
uniref:EF-hand_like domain-containing protein n=1 Tax=Heterorhabditis bacteriophora TaxID=37862 RepID=A0A1I7WYW8_HETBA